MKKLFVVILLLGGASVAYGYYYGFRTIEFVPEVTTTRVNPGDVVDTVGATGALEAVTTVQVGSQVSGIIQELNVDFNSIVREGDVIMRLDPSLFETQIEQSRANLLRAEADGERLHVSVDDARTQLRRARELADANLISPTELDAAEVAVRSAEAQLKSSEAQVTQAQASLNQTEVNLEHTVIRAPIDGIVTSRLVDVGQTVAASFQAPELFVIAADLTKMRVIADIDESDVGRIRPNQRVTFTVDAYPGELFEGTVSQIRLEPMLTQNVVTYATVIDAPNPELKLKPGMTATVTVEVARRNQVPRVANAAIRFRPTPAMFAALNQPVPPETRGDRPADAMTSAGTGGPGAPAAAAADAAGAGGGEPGGPGGVGGFGGQGGPPSEQQRQQMRERMQQMSPEEREQFRAERGRAGAGGPGGLGRPRAAGGPGGFGRGGGAAPEARQPTTASAADSVPTVDRGATTIDALFAPLEVAERRARVWLLNDAGQLQGVDVRLGVTDGTASELIEVLDGGASITDGALLVTNVSTPEAGARAPSGIASSPLMPQFPFGRRGR